MPGLNCAQWNAARIPPKGLVFGAIDPAMHAVGMDARKETQQCMPGRLRDAFIQPRPLPLEVVGKG